MARPKIKSQSKAQFIVDGKRPMRVAKTRGTVEMLEPTVAPSGKAPVVHVPNGALLAPPLDNVPHEKWPAELRMHYETALKNAEGAKLYQHGASAGVGLEH